MYQDVPSTSKYQALHSTEVATTLAFIPVLGTGFPACQMACMDLSIAARALVLFLLPRLSSIYLINEFR